MPMDAEISRAYAVLERAFHTDFLSKIPSRHNLEFREWLERKFLWRIGVSLPSLPESLHRSWIAHLLQRYFWRELGLSDRPSLPNEIPVFLLRDGYELPSVNVVTLSKALGTMAPFDAAPLCIAERRFALLQELLHLQPAEVSLLQLAYAASPHGWPNALDQPYEEDHHALNTVLSSLRWNDVAERDHLFATMLEVAKDDASALFAPPITLIALHLLDNASWHEGRGARSYANATDKLLSLLEAKYETHAALLADLETASYDAGFDPDYPADLLYEELPESVANAYLAARHGQALNTSQLASLVWWNTAASMSVDSLQPLSEKLYHEAVIRALCKSTLANRVAGECVTTRTLFETLNKGIRK